MRAFFAVFLIKKINNGGSLVKKSWQTCALFFIHLARNSTRTATDDHSLQTLFHTQALMLMKMLLILLMIMSNIYLSIQSVCHNKKQPIINNGRFVLADKLIKLDQDL